VARPAKTLGAFVAHELAGSVQPAARAMANALKDDFNGSPVAVLYYGSCLRTGETDGLILDFYVIVPDYKSAHNNIFSRAGNALIPPNVYYREIKDKAGTVRAKVAVLSLADFERRVEGRTLNVSVWARFAQPSRLVYARSKDIQSKIEAAVETAVKTMVREVLPQAPAKTPEALWVSALGRTYGAELRSEGPEKAKELYDLNKDYFKTVTPLALEALSGGALRGAGAQRRKWFFRTLNGKVVSLFRLIKAMFTFQGGIDYLAWKIKRSSGVEVEIKPWHRKVPLIAGMVLFIQLRLKGAFR